MQQWESFTLDSVRTCAAFAWIMAAQDDDLGGLPSCRVARDFSHCVFFQCELTITDLKLVLGLYITTIPYLGSKPVITKVFLLALMGLEPDALPSACICPC